MTAQLAFGVLMVAIQAGLLWPLIARLVYTRSGAGISVVGEGMWVFAGVGWAAYGALTGSIPLTVSGALAAAGSLGVVALVGLGKARGRARALGVAVATSLMLVVGAAGWGVTGLGVALAAVGIVQFLPQMWVSAQSFARRERTPGVSVIAAYLRALYALGWATYAGAWFLWGTAFQDIAWPLVVWGVAGFSAYILQGTVAAIDRESVKSRPVA